MPAENHLKLAWVVPATAFALEQNAAFNPTSWVGVSNVPALNPAQLHYEVFLSPTVDQCFYRLASP
jgi:hypothetical protein